MLSFKQFGFPSGQDFEPSKATKDFWLYTKKSKRTYAGVTLPGLYETIGYSTQMIAFFAIFVLEIIPTVYGIGEGVLWQAIAAAIFIDVFLAIVSHLWHDKICLYKNELVVDSDPIVQVALRRKISSYSLYTNFFYVLILVSGCLKFYFFYDAYMVADAIAGAVLVCYLLGAILHIAYTGYFLYTSRFNYKIQSEYTEFITSRGKSFTVTAKNSQIIDTDNTNVKLMEYKLRKHEIINQNGTYYFDTFGVLTDADLAEFVLIQQSNAAKVIIARDGLKQQISNLQGGLGQGNVNRANKNQPSLNQN